MVVLEVVEHQAGLDQVCLHFQEDLEYLDKEIMVVKLTTVVVINLLEVVVQVLLEQM